MQNAKNLCISKAEFWKNGRVKYVRYIVYLLVQFWNEWILLRAPEVRVVAYCPIQDAGYPLCLVGVSITTIPSFLGELLARLCV